MKAHAVSHCIILACQNPAGSDHLYVARQVHPGQSTLIFYNAHNTSDKAITGVSTYNVAPQQAGFYFNKIQCFCFEEQKLRPGMRPSVAWQGTEHKRFCSCQPSSHTGQAVLCRCVLCGLYVCTICTVQLVLDSIPAISLS